MANGIIHYTRVKLVMLFCNASLVFQKASQNLPVLDDEMTGSFQHRILPKFMVHIILCSAFQIDDFTGLTVFVASFVESSSVMSG